MALPIFSTFNGVNFKIMNEPGKAASASKKLTTILFILYLAVIAWILLFKFGVRFSYMQNRSTNLVPFGGPSVLSSENILNTVIFIPLGIYSASLFKNWKFSKNLLFFFSLSLLIESLQFMLRIGAFDVTDIITNTFGGAIGWMIFKTLENLFGNRVKTERFVNVIATIGTVIMILLLVLLKLSLLPVRYQ